MIGSTEIITSFNVITETLYLPELGQLAAFDEVCSLTPGR
jgi:hypothetical protein